MRKKDRDLDEIYADTWVRREQKLRGMTYSEYLASDHWQLVKEKAASRPNYKKCEFCSSTEVELHHTSYKWIFTHDELRTIISLCRDHHAEVHDLARSSGQSVRKATNELRRSYKPNYWGKNRVPE